MSKQEILIVGAGITGLSAAYDLLRAGHAVTILEAADHTGGLAAGFQDERWEWPLEKFYHHLFTNDEAIIRLVETLGIRDRLFFPRPLTSVIYQGEVVPFDSPLAAIRYPAFNLLDVARFGLVTAFLRFSNAWRRLEQETADSWMRRWYGQKIYDLTWRPLLLGKFGPHYQEANMAWMWARLKVRSPRLGYFHGGFQFFIDTLTEAVRTMGGSIHLRTPVHHIRSHGNRLKVDSDGHSFEADRVLVTTSPSLLHRMVPTLPDSYADQLRQLKSMGAVVLTLALKQPLMQDTYWLNIPATSPEKQENEIPFLALVEHTNYIDRRHYGGDHIVYCGDYVTPDHPYLRMNREEIEEIFSSHLHKINPDYRPDWIRKSWLYSARYAQPVPEVGHSKHIPALRTPVPGLYFASMSQVYPWDRGTNYAVAIGREVSQLILTDLHGNCGKENNSKE